MAAKFDWEGPRELLCSSPSAGPCAQPESAKVSSDNDKLARDWVSGVQ